MHSIAAESGSLNEVAILARVLGKEHGQLPATTARYYLNLEFTETDKARMHDLAVRNQGGLLSAVEQQELMAFAKAGSLLSILKSRARLALKIKPKKRAKP